MLCQNVGYLLLGAIDSIWA